MTARTCARCGTPRAVQDAFCAECGAPLPPFGAAPSGALTAPTVGDAPWAEQPAPAAPRRRWPPWGAAQRGHQP